jgi:hypothetical protein
VPRSSVARAGPVDVSSPLRMLNDSLSPSDLPLVFCHTAPLGRHAS